VRELSLHILDVVENSLAAKATRINIEIVECLAEDRLTITIEDNGVGMDQEMAIRSVDPFFSTRSTRRIGLGLPLFKAAAEHCNGQFRLESEPGKATTICVQFQHSHIDRVPVGNMTGTLMSLLLSDRLLSLGYVHHVGDRTFEFDTEDVKQTLEDVPISHPLVQEWLLDHLSEGENSLWDD
jgi:hypothetical protein